MPQAVVLVRFLEYSYANHIKFSSTVYTIIPPLPTAFVLDNNCVKQVLQVLYQLSHCATTFKSLKLITLLFSLILLPLWAINGLLLSGSHVKIFDMTRGMAV